MDRETERNIKRLEREIGLLQTEDRLLRERIAASTGASSERFFSAGTLSGTLTTGNGIIGGGTFPGLVTIAVDLHDTWSGLEFDGGELRIDQDAVFTWTSLHTFEAGWEITAGNGVIADARWIGTASDDLRIEFDSASGVTVFHFGDAAGSDEVRFMDSSPATVGKVDSDGYITMDGIGAFHTGVRGELLSTHTAIGEAHGLGGTVVIAPCGALRTAIVIV